ncbi:hypothetical protein [Planctomyces sp. SH-PL62]|uniref:hypothetical protein n=1 Tax=Planctomyces sp. SH-PL62 TaxID=1636152 RepID=UPI00078D0AEB|nr:hypothetical protein [Planctomyces sp. SH-PL62]AMV35887.1 hypothetical protein VT85_00485 [Planctomyces sp. SH-PL62]
MSHTRRAGLALAILLSALAAPARGATEIKLEKGYLAGVVEKLPPNRFDQEKYRGSVHSYRLVGIDPKERKLLAAFTAEGEFRPPASGPLSENASRSKDHVDGWRKFRFDIKASVNVEAGPDGSPRFRVDVDEVKRTELEGVAGLLAKLLGKQFDAIATQVVDGKAESVNQKLNAEILKRAAMYKDYGVLCGLDYAPDFVVLKFDLTRLERQGTLGYIFREPRPGAVPLHRWLNVRTGAHRYTLSPTIDVPGAFTPEGLAGYVPTADAPGAVSVELLRSRTDHLYTTDPNSERIRPRLYQSEGVAFHVLPEPIDGAVPFHRFHDPRRGTHFYTTHPHAEFAK